MRKFEPSNSALDVESAVAAADSPAEGGVAPSPALIKAVAKVLKPLVSFLLAKGITYTWLANFLKQVFVEVASEEYKLSGKRLTDSRISLLTGVHRKDVRRLTRPPEVPIDAPANVSFGARLIARWCGDPRFLDAHGQPLPLPRMARVTGEPSFDGLVEAESKDIRSRSVLDEWLRLGLVERDAQDIIFLKTAAFIPSEGSEEKLYYFGRNLHDHLAAAAHNVLDKAPPMTERSVYYDQLSPASVETLAKLAREVGMEALQTVNRQAMALQLADQGRAESIERMNFGLYFFHGEMTPELTATDNQGAAS